MKPEEMKPEKLVLPEEQVLLTKAFMRFASTFLVADARRDILENAGVSPAMLNFIQLHTNNSFVFANSVVATFQKPQFLGQVIDCLSSILKSEPANYGFGEQDVILFKKIIERGRENLNALKARSSVGRIESPQGTGIGTGVLIAKNMLLTCHHVLKNIQQAWVRFDYQEGSDGIEDVFELDMKFIACQPRIDYVLVKICGQPEQEIAVPVDKVLSSGEETRIRIIHHPQGKPVVVSEAGLIMQIGEDYIDHNVATDEGSSGAPIFDQDWDLVAIHRGDPGIERPVPPGTTAGVPIRAIWDEISSHID